MADIFISYASEDRDRIAMIVGALEKAGWTVFWDRKTPVGMSWEQHIEQNLQQATCVLVVWSEVSINKDWVKIEAREGLGRDCLVPVRIDPVSPPFGFGHKQFADLVGWTDDTAHPEWQELITAVNRLAPRAAGAETAPDPPASDPQGTPPLKLSVYWQRLLDSPSASELQQLVDEVQALREAHPTDPELIKLQRRIADAAQPARPRAAKPHAAAPSRKLIWAVAAVLVLAVAGVMLKLYSEQPSTPEATAEPTSPATSDLPLPDLVPIPEGCFTMGSRKDDAGRRDDESPQHQVCLEGFRMGRHEVTFEHYDAFAEATGRNLPEDESWGRGNRPVINVSREDARAYTEWLSAQLGSQCSLPSEAQWEYAARAGTTKRYAVPKPEGSDDIKGKTLANCDGCGSQWDNKKTAPVGSFKPNAWDLYDMHGNVWEWVQDCWHDNYQNAPADGTAWGTENGGNCDYRVLRGGSWVHSPEGARSADRGGVDPDYRDLNIGFRVLCSGP